MNTEIITWAQLPQYIRDTQTQIIDLRDEDAYAKGHVTGAWNIRYEDLDKYRRRFQQYDRVVLYCDHGSHSLMAAKQLARKGIHAVSILGGYEAAKKNT